MGRWKHVSMLNLLIFLLQILLLIQLLISDPLFSSRIISVIPLNLTYLWIQLKKRNYSMPAVLHW
jgi:hypothetical protein